MKRRISCMGITAAHVALLLIMPLRSAAGNGRGDASPACFFAELNRAMGPKLEFADKDSTGVGAMQNATACLKALRWSAQVDERNEHAGETEADRERLCSLSAFPSSAAEALPERAWHSGKGVLFAVTAYVADMHNERITMLTLRSVRLFHPAADILVVDNASPSSMGRISGEGRSGSGGGVGGTKAGNSSNHGGYDSHAFFAQLPKALACAYSGCCDGEAGERLHGCNPSTSRETSASAFGSSSACGCCGRVVVERFLEAGATSKAMGSLREFGALAQAALHVHYLPAADPHHIVLLQSSTGLKRPIEFAALADAECPFTFLHMPYSWWCCQTQSAADVRMRTARWGLSCSEAAFSRHGFARSFMQSTPNSLWSASSHGAVVMTRGVLARLVAMGLFQLDVLDAMGNGRMCWETSAGLVGAWLAQERRMGASVAAGAANASAFRVKGGPLDARCIQPVAYKLHGNNIERMKDLNPKLQHLFKELAVRTTREAGKAVEETLPECTSWSGHAAHFRLALNSASATMARGGRWSRCAENASAAQAEVLTELPAASKIGPRRLGSIDGGGGSDVSAPPLDGRKQLAELRPVWMHKQRSEMGRQRLCVVVISAAPHAHLLPRVVHSVLASTLPPEQLIIALSGVSDSVCARANASISRVLATAPIMRLRLLCTERMRSSGQNRNRGAAACDLSNASADKDAFISFIDSDDELLPDRSATITALMRRHRADLGLHSYVGAKDCCHSPPRIITPEEAARLYAAMPRCTRVGFTSRCADPPASLACRLHDKCSTSRCAHMSRCVHFLPGSLTRVHYAHATVRASVFRSLKQREGAAYGKVEDSWFARDMAALGLRIVATDEALTMYNRTSGHIQPPGLLAKSKSGRS